ncbi:MAG: LacI family transcriptional regulator [Bifidobacteriaceae bacterium]|jgi:DNA-binding LacI/PurR family transcriptional regulator|nr:LacI family transcriptional regulator [Bifidobacteriaceae bacterium]
MRENSGRRATSADVAREAGVSRTTVSYVLNGADPTEVSEATRERVFAAARRLDYTTDGAARTLKRGRSDFVLVLMENLPFSPLVGATSFAMSEELSKNGLTLLLVPWASRRQPLPSLIATLSPAAIITVEPLPRADIATARRFGVPLVTVAGGGVAADGFGDTYRSIGRLQGCEMIAMGYERLVVALPTDQRQIAGARIRMAGVGDACAEAGLPTPEAVAVGADPTQAERVVGELRNCAHRIGVCAYDDDVALTMIGAAARLELTVPGVFGVIGVDDTHAGRVALPALTTIAWNGDAIASSAARAVLRQLGAAAATDDAVHADLVRVVRRASA